MFRNEKAYIEKISESDHSAFKALFSYYYPKVKIYLRKILQDSTASDDLAQEIFVKIWLKRESLKNIENFGAYLHSMSRNAAYDFLKTVKTDFSIEFIDAIEDSIIDEYIDAEQKRKNIDNFVKLMPKKRRQIYEMSRIQSLSNEEIAKQLGLSKKTVENHINLALKFLRKSMIILLFIL